MGSSRIAKATVVLERLDRQAVTLERLAVIEQQTVRLVEAGISYDVILASRDEMNAFADDGVQYDFNDALLLLYDEMFGTTVAEEER
jgi:hypothetical protein